MLFFWQGCGRAATGRRKASESRERFLRFFIQGHQLPEALRRNLLPGPAEVERILQEHIGPSDRRAYSSIYQRAGAYA